MPLGAEPPLPCRHHPAGAGLFSALMLSDPAEPVLGLRQPSSGRFLGCLGTERALPFLCSLAAHLREHRRT
jgi:hypothetical protein